MSRLNRPRSIGGEANLADRVAYERERLGLSYEALAKKMTEAGCSIQGSAIFKVEKGQPRRRITVDELLAFAEVFGVSVEALLTPMDLLMQQEALALLKQIEEGEKGLLRASMDLFDAYRRFVDLQASGQVEVIEYLLNHSDTYVRDQQQQFDEASKLVPGITSRRQRLEPFTEACRAHNHQLLQMAQEGVGF